MKKLLLLAFIWGWSFLFIKVAVRGMPPTMVAAGRIALGAGVLYAYVWSRGLELPRDRATWKRFGVAAFFGNVLPFTMLAWGEERVSSALTAVLNASTPLFTALIAVYLLRERLKPSQIAGLLIGMVGVGVAAGVGSGDLASSSLLGGLASVLAGACYGFAFNYMRRHLVELPPVVAATGQLIAGTVMLLPVGLLASATSDLDLAPRRLLSLLVLGAVGTGIAYVISYGLVADLGPTKASLVTYIIPVVAVAVGVAVLDEPFHVRILGGGVLIVLGIALVQERLRRRPPGRDAVLGPAVRAVVLLAAIASVAAGLGACSGDDTAEPSASCGDVVEEPLDPGSSNHLLPGAPEPSYVTDPPTSGPHLSGPTPSGVVDEPLDRPRQVAILEGGGVVIQHEGVEGADLRPIDALAGDTVVVAPGVDLPAPLVATAWRSKLICDTADADAVAEFIADHEGLGPDTEASGRSGDG